MDGEKVRNRRVQLVGFLTARLQGLMIAALSSTALAGRGNDTRRFGGAEAALKDGKATRAPDLDVW
jgi:hypothetical protein